MLTIGIAGGTGSGKTTVVQKITEHFSEGEVVVVPQDSYYRDNSDIPLLEDRQKINTLTVHPAHIIIVEGILIFTDARLRKMLDILVYVDADPDDRLVRVIARDTMERGRDVGKVIDRYEKTLKPMHLQFIEPTKRYADLILPQGGHNQVGIEMLIATIENHLKHN